GYYIEGPLGDCAHFHQGVDLSGGEIRQGGPALAIQEGIVTFAGVSQHGTGNTVVVRLPSGWTYRYGHLGSIGVRVGEGIAAGDSLGTVGSTGASTGPHIHLEIRDELNRL